MQKKILVVDDDAAVRELLNDFLSGIGYEVVEAENGLVALELLAEDDFNAIITDLEMPMMDGYELVKKVRDVINLSVPILLISALADEEQKKKSKELIYQKKIDFFILKPVDLLDLKNFLEKV